MKLSKTEKIQRKDRLEELEGMGGMIDSCPDNKFTVAVVPANTFDAAVWHYGEDTEFFYIAASYCAATDEFRRKRGELIALERLFAGEFMIVPSYGRTVEEMLLQTMEFVMNE